MSEYVARLTKVLDESYGFDVEMDRGISEPLAALAAIEAESAALKRQVQSLKDYIDMIHPDCLPEANHE